MARKTTPKMPAKVLNKLADPKNYDQMHEAIKAHNLNQGNEAPDTRVNRNGVPLTRNSGMETPVRNDVPFFQPGNIPFLIRENFLDLLIDPRHNIDRECGYPEDINPLMYWLMYQRDGIANRIVNIWPEESWSMDPIVYEHEDEDKETDFEVEWNKLLKRLNLWYELHRADVLSGIGRFGVLLLGIDDGKPYSQPAAGLDEYGLPIIKNKQGHMMTCNDDGSNPRLVKHNYLGMNAASKNGAGKGHKLLFVRSFAETACQVLQREINPQNPRYGKPTRYLLTFRELDITEPAMLGTTAGGMTTAQVHWTRVIHLADNREMSEIYGVPRMKPHWNRICDIRKLTGGSAEMFWKGAFPGLSFEFQPGVELQQTGTEEDQAQVQQAIQRYADGLDRWLAVAGMTAKSLAPNVADPKSHIEMLMDQISVALGVPKRIFLGSEQAQLAASMDAKNWARRVNKRQDKYVGPKIIREFIDRCMELGILPQPKDEDEYTVWWPDINAVSDQEKAQILLTKTQAAAAYMQGGVDNLIPPQEWLSIFHDMPPDEVEQIMKAQAEYVGAKTDLLEEAMNATPNNVKPTPKQAGQSVKLAEQTNFSPAEVE